MPLKILVVDDELIVLKTVDVILRRAGYDVMAANSAETALEFAGANGGHIAMLMVNHSLTAQSGRNIVDDVLSIQPDIQVLRFSGHLESELGPKAKYAPKAFFFKSLSRQSNCSTKYASLLEQHQLQTTANPASLCGSSP